MILSREILFPHFYWWKCSPCKVKLLVTKSETCKMIIALIECAEVETGERVNSLCSDGRGEFGSKDLAVMRLHYLWPQKLQNHTILVNLEAIWTTTIASKLFQPLYLGYNQVLHYIVYGLQLSSFNISSAFTSDRHPRTYPLSSDISSRS